LVGKTGLDKQGRALLIEQRAFELNNDHSSKMGNRHERSQAAHLRDDEM